MFTITLHGFKTKEEADAFASWYEGSGEQYAGEDQLIGFPTYTDMKKWKERWNGTNMDLHLT